LRAAPASGCIFALLAGSILIGAPDSLAQEVGPKAPSTALTDQVERARNELARRLRERAQELDSEERARNDLARRLRERAREFETPKGEPFSTGTMTGLAPILTVPVPLPQARVAAASPRGAGIELDRLFNPTPLGGPERLRASPDRGQARGREPDARRPAAPRLEAAIQPPAPAPAAPPIPIPPQAAAPAPKPPAAAPAAPLPSPPPHPEPPPRATAALPDEAEPPPDRDRHVTPLPAKPAAKPAAREPPARPTRAARTEEPSAESLRDDDVDVSPAPRRRPRRTRAARGRGAPETTGSVSRAQRSRQARPAPPGHSPDAVPLITLPESLRPTRPPAGSRL
jgi:hypothetical protein